MCELKIATLVQDRETIGLERRWWPFCVDIKAI